MCEFFYIVLIQQLCFLSILDTTLAAAVAPIQENHIVSFVAQTKTGTHYDKLASFDFENFHEASNNTLKKSKLIKTGDLPNNIENTLENINESFNNNDVTEETPLHDIPRSKQSIPVLESVRHLLNTVREGGYNHTMQFNITRHHLVRPGEISSNDAGVDATENSSAIETEKDRETVNDSTNLKVLDFLASLGRMMWEFLMNIKKILFNNIGNASSASSLIGIY